MIGWMLGAVFVTAWIVGSVLMIVVPVLWLTKGGGWRDDGLVALGFSTIFIVSGVLLLLLLAAIATGDLSFSTVKDGCYHVYRVGSGKTSHMEYDPIECPTWLRR